jgi:hypothetical protein
MRSIALSAVTLAGITTMFALGAVGADARAAGGKGTIKRDGATILVKFDKPAHAHTVVGEEGDAILGTTAGKVSIVKLHSGKGVDQALDRYQRRDDVVYAEPNFLAAATLSAPNDPYYTQQWGLSKVDALDGWAVYPGTYSASPGPTIAVIDTGVDTTHPDLSAHLLLASGANCLSGVCDGSGLVADDNGHGTHVTGIAAALTNNNMTGIDRHGFVRRRLGRDRLGHEPRGEGDQPQLGRLRVLVDALRRRDVSSQRWCSRRRRGGERQHLRGVLPGRLPGCRRRRRHRLGGRESVVLELRVARRVRLRSRCVDPVDVYG